MLKLLIANMDEKRVVRCEKYGLDVDFHRIRRLAEKGYLVQLYDNYLPGIVFVETDAEDVVLAFDESQNEQRRQASENAAKEKQQHAERMKEKKQDRRHDYLIAAFSAIVGSLLTLLVEHFDKLVMFLKKLVH